MAARSLEGGVPEDCSSELREKIRRFLSAGVAAVGTDARPWLEYRISFGHERRAELYGELRALVRGVTGEGLAGQFFHMNKPPGARLRFEADSRTVADLRTRLLDSFTGWRERGLIDGFRHAVYEPEYSLFGGVEAMPSVHALFTHDSMVWLDYYAAGAEAGHAWKLSLRMVKELLRGLEIADLEDLGVWDRLVREAGRGFPGAAPEDWERISGRIADAWQHAGHLELHAEIKGSQALALYEEQLPVICDRWREDCFHDADARTGRVAFATSAIVFHWNRGLLTPGWQIAVSEALRSRDRRIRG